MGRALRCKGLGEHRDDTKIRAALHRAAFSHQACKVYHHMHTLKAVSKLERPLRNTQIVLAVFGIVIVLLLNPPPRLRRRS
jgi:hypothetical protein